jgi:hypothetical protein
MLFDKNRRPVPLPENYTGQRLGNIIRPVSSDQTWAALTYRHPLKHSYFSKALFHPRDLATELLKEIGYTPVQSINLLDYKSDPAMADEETQDRKLAADVQVAFERV